MANTLLLSLALAIFIFIIGKKALISANPNVHNVSAEEAYKLINKNKGFIILDVRTKGEYENGHIQGAKSLPVQILASKINELEKYKNSPILVYCASGGRSPKAVTALIRNNFTQIYHLSRGISSWGYSLKK